MEWSTRPIVAERPFENDVRADVTRRMEGSRMTLFWDENTGAAQLADGARLYAHMPRQEVLRAFAAVAYAQPPAEYKTETVIPFPAFAVAGGRLACVCLLHNDKLHAVSFTVAGVGAKRRGNADQQRALLFQCLRAADPARDSKRGALLRCPFGTALVATDPRTGDATLRMTYR
jgi:hypothetical protein